MEKKIEETLHIDVGAVLSSKLGRKARLIPRFVVNALRRLVKERELNALLESNRGAMGVDFSRGVLRDLEVTYEIKGCFPRDKRVIIACNHPLGGLDGIAMSCAVADAYGSDGLKFVVNDMLQAVVPMRPIFLPVNKVGSQNRRDVAELDRAFASDGPIVMFPAGLVSRKNDNGRVEDLRWNKMVVAKAVEYQRDVVPVWFSGRNSSFFYNFARLRKKTGLKFNLEMSLLPREVFRARGSHFTIVIGRAVSWEGFRGGASALSEAQALRDRVYSLAVEATP